MRVTNVLIAGVVVSVLGLTSCSRPSSSLIALPPQLDSLKQAHALPDSIQLSLEFALPKRHYHPGEPIRFEPRLVNDGNRPVPIVHGSNASKVIVYRGGKLVYPDPPVFSWFDDAFRQTIKPGDTYVDSLGQGELVIELHERGNFYVRVMMSLHIGEEYFAPLGEDVAYREFAENRFLFSDPVQLDIQ